MSDGVWNAFAAMYSVREQLDAAVQEARSSVKGAEGGKYDKLRKALERVLENEEFWDAFQDAIDLLEELTDD